MLKTEISVKTNISPGGIDPDICFHLILGTNHNEFILSIAEAEKVKTELESAIFSASIKKARMIATGKTRPKNQPKVRRYLHFSYNSPIKIRSKEGFLAVSPV